jgi:hypothetical protein
MTGWQRGLQPFPVLANGRWRRRARRRFWPDLTNAGSDRNAPVDKIGNSTLWASPGHDRRLAQPAHEKSSMQQTTVRHHPQQLTWPQG